MKELTNEELAGVLAKHGVIDHNALEDNAYDCGITRDKALAAATAIREAVEGPWREEKASIVGVYEKVVAEQKDTILGFLDQIRLLQSQLSDASTRNADLLAALQIVKDNRQWWWGKAVERGQLLAAANRGAERNARINRELAAKNVELKQQLSDAERRVRAACSQAVLDECQFDYESEDLRTPWFNNELIRLAAILRGENYE